MRLEFINRVSDNEVLGKTIYTEDGSILLRAGVRLSRNYIERLKLLGVYYVYVEDDRLDDIQVEDEKLGEIKHNVIKNMSKVIKNISSGSPLKTKKSLNVVEDLVDYLVECGDVNKSLYDIKTYDNYTFIHSLDTSIMTAFLALSCNIKGERLKELTKGAILHDVGKTKIPIKILNKAGALSQEEYEIIKKHTIYGEEILKKSKAFSEIAIKAVAEHHERVDGNGYPNGHKENEFSIYGKIVSISDVYDAITNDRCYRKKYSPSEAYEFILAGNGSKFDEKLVNYFKETFAVYPLGCCVKLNNGIEGYVIKQNKSFPDRPVIRVLYDYATKVPIPFYEIDLLFDSTLVISSTVS